MAAGESVIPLSLSLSLLLIGFFAGSAFLFNFNLSSVTNAAAQTRDNLLSALGGFHVDEPLEQQPETSEDWGMFGNLTSGGLDIVSSNNWRFVPASTSTYPDPAATLDTQGNLTLNGLFTTGSLFVSNTSTFSDTLTGTGAVFNTLTATSTASETLSLSSSLALGNLASIELNTDTGQRGNAAIIYDKNRGIWMLRHKNGFFSEILTKASQTTGTSDTDTNLNESQVENFVLGDYDNSSLCDTGWVWVPGSAKYGTLPGFCVMQFEAKDVSGVATSQADTTPWVSISQEDARTECSDLGDGYHLVTEAERMTINENVASNSANWADGTIGSTVSSGGGLFRGNVGISDSASYDGDNPEFGTGRDTKARHTLTNGKQIWDLSGNVWEWTDEIMNAGEHPEDDTPASEWLSFTGITKYRALNYVRPPDDAWSETHGVGRLFTDVGDTATAVRAFLRGGNWNDGSNAGVFALNLNNAPSITGTGIGFRCAR